MDGWMADPNPQGILKEIHPVIPQIDLIFASAALMLSCPDMICAASACYSFFFFLKRRVRLEQSVTMENKELTSTLRKEVLNARSSESVCVCVCCLSQSEMA